MVSRLKFLKCFNFRSIFGLYICTTAHIMDLTVYITYPIQYTYVVPDFRIYYIVIVHLIQNKKSKNVSTYLYIIHNIGCSTQAVVSYIGWHLVAVYTI